MSDFWMLTYTGKKFDFMDYKDKDIDIVDIAHHLSRLCRFNGAVKGFYTVAEHSAIMANEIMANGDKGLAKYALLHDAPEAYMGDMVRGLKNFLGEVSGYKIAERRLQRTIYAKFGLEVPVSFTASRELRHWDNAMLVSEAEKMLDNPNVAFDTFEEEPIFRVNIGASMLPKRACSYFMHLYNKLWSL